MSNNAEQQTRLSSPTWLQWMGIIRENLLVAGTVVYILGYMVWSLHAAENKLGLLPALDVQYFVAGVIPALLIYLVFRIVKLTLKVTERFQKWLYVYKGRSKWKLFVRKGLLFCFLLITLVLCANRDLNVVFCISAFLLIYLSTIIRPPILSGEEESKWDRYYRVFQISGLLFLLGLIVFYFYYSVLYRNLPQELGGVRPRCAYLDFAKEQVSTETLESIVPVTALNSDQPVVQSFQIEILFSGGNVLVIRSKDQVFEIAKSVIQVIRPCD